MKLSGEAHLAAPPESAFRILLDRDALQRCIPGCESLDETEAGVFEAKIKAGVGAIKGRFNATVTLSDLVEAESYTLSVRAKSPVGHASGAARIALAPDGDTTRLTYEGDVKVSGMIAAVGQRLLGATARKFATAFFDAMASEINAS